MNTIRLSQLFGAPVVAMALVAAACGSTSSETAEIGGSAESATADYAGPYTLVDEQFGTMVTVSIDGDSRIIETNALPDHETGEFPNAGNPNTISAQDLIWEVPLTPTYSGEATELGVTGVAVNGVKFEPGTAETVSCDSGEIYRVEGLQDLYDLGMDFNNAHVQPTGEYHYHGVSDLLVEAYATDDDLVHIGFAADGHLVYYSKSGDYSSSYALGDETRTGDGCVGSGALAAAGVGDVIVNGTTPDGTYTSDWLYTEGSGDLDECNGISIDGEYAYLITDEYPYIPRCVQGEVIDSAFRAGAGGTGAP